MHEERRPGRAPGVTAATACLLLLLASCTTSAPPPSASQASSSPSASGGSPSATGTPGPTTQPPTTTPATLFAGQTLAYAHHGFTTTELAALRAALPAPVTAVYTAERQLRALRPGAAIPVATMYADPDSYAAAVGMPGLAQQLRSGVVLASYEATLRHVGVGGAVVFADGVSLPVTAVVDAHVLGGYEIASSSHRLRPAPGDTSAYVLIGGGQSVEVVARLVRAALPHRALRIETRTANGYLSSIDSVLTQLQMKQLFGEFSMRSLPGGALVPDPTWEEAHVAHRVVTQLGEIMCNKGVLADLTAAMTEISRTHLGALVHTDDFQYEGGCYNPTVIPFSHGGTVSSHTWAIAVDINVDANDLGAPPHQDPRLVAIMRAHNFTWGGRWLRPDAAHFEWVGPTVRH